MLNKNKQNKQNIQNIQNTQQEQTIEQGNAEIQRNFEEEEVN